MDTNNEQECQHEDLEHLEVIWSDSERCCWVCQCLLCGEQIEVMVTYDQQEG